ncbi:chemotaxis protein [Litorivicinus lipolyticus]|uniref:Chemotaxis protein n=2 Tax=Litorivicinus lipolyticus TaxID=418701 RepID=A0A5Q2QAC9_9GAMM|nr:chemotaxis protein [Litorivicinus lipolyticus]
MDNIVVRSPALGEFAGQARGLGAGIVARGVLTATEAEKLQGLQIRIEDAFAGAMNALQTAGNNNADVAKKIQGQLTTLSARGNEAEALIARIMNRDFTGMTSASYFDAMTAVIAANGAAVTESAILLDGLLADRIDDFNNALYTTLAVVAVMVVFAAAFTLKTMAYQNALLARVNNHFEEIRAGNLDQSIIARTTDAFGKLFQGLAEMQDSLRERRAQDRLALETSSRIKQGLDSVNTSTMIADADGNIIYLNRSAQALMTSSNDNLRAILPNFDHNTVLGSNFDIFHANPAHQRNLLGNLTGTHTSEISVGTQIFQLIANPVFDDDKQRLGTIVEWDERTLERAVEKEIESIVGQASNGNLSARIAEHDKDGFMLTLAQGVNKMAESAEAIVGETNTVMSAMAAGDLTQRITSNFEGQFGELATNVNQTIAQMTSTIEQILQSSEQIRAGAEEIAQGNSDLSHRTEEQASSLEETASSMEEMTGLVRQTAENARNVNELASGVRDDAAAGGDVVKKAVDAMGAISESSKQISDIITVIDEIAFQTNLLALNAAVEAARAGEQGRGFAVVAGEVRSLAQRSAEAAKEIKDLIRDSSNKVSDGTQLVNQSGETLQSLVTSIATVADRVAEITRAADEQSSGIEQVNTAISQMDEMTQQNAALVEQASAAGENMAEQARQMVAAANVFKVDGSGGTGARTPAQVTPAPPRVQPKPAPVSSPSRHDAHSVSDDDEWDEF